MTQHHATCDVHISTMSPNTEPTVVEMQQETQLLQMNNLESDSRINGNQMISHVSPPISDPPCTFPRYYHFWYCRL